MLLMDPDPWEVDWVSWWEQWLERGRRLDDWSGRSDTLVGGRTVARKLSSPLTPSPCSPNRTPHFKLSHSRSRISRISHSPPWNFLTSTLSCSVAFNHFWAQVQLSCVLVPEQKGAFLWTARCSLFALLSALPPSYPFSLSEWVNSNVPSLCSPSNPSLPPYLSHSALSLPTFSLSREFFVLHCKLFLHLKLFFRSFRYFCFQILSPSWQAVENGIENGIRESGDDWLGDYPEEYWWQLNLHLITYKHVDPLIFGPRTWL